MKEIYKKKTFCYFKTCFKKTSKKRKKNQISITIISSFQITVKNKFKKGFNSNALQKYFKREKLNFQVAFS